MNMKSLILSILLILIFSGCSKNLDNKIVFFKDYNFNSGDFRLYGFGGEGTGIDDVRNFVIQDSVTLNQIKKKWIFKYKSDVMPCGFDYHFVLIEKDRMLKQFNVNLDCEYMTFEKKWLKFPKHYLSDFKGKFEILDVIESDSLFKKCPSPNYA